MRRRTMPIKEEPVRIEFQYEPEDAQGATEMLKIEYFSEMRGDNEKKYLSIMPAGADSPHIFEVDFFVEIVDFLRKKGVVGQKVEEIPEGPTPRSALPLPSIQMSGEQREIPAQGLPTLPVVDNPTYIPVTALIPPETKTAVAPKVFTAADAGTVPVINRPVIKTRVSENEDPMKAIIDSQRQRKTNPAKSIKRKEEADEV
jgi:hypothetical protein